MRRERYQYWTLGHVLSTGLIDPESAQPLKFHNLPAFFTFYRSVLKRVSSSQYEQAICDFYLDDLSQSKTPLEEPLLVPELRYAGKDKKHKYRLDFTVLNGHTLRLTGFELSPASSHLRIKGMQSKTQKLVNEELAATWAKEIEKRNEYFEEYGISTVTFADNDLSDLNNCFLKIRRALQERSVSHVSIEQALHSLNAYRSKTTFPF